MSETEKQLSRQIEELIKQLRPRLRQILSSYNIPYPDSEDLLQDTLVAAFSRWETIQSKDAWILGTLRNKCSIYWKKQRSARLQAVDLPVLESLSEPMPPLQERSEQIWDLEALAVILSRRHWFVLWLRFGLGMSTTEIAARTGYNDSSIRKLTCRSVARLQRELAAPLLRRAGPKPA